MTAPDFNKLAAELAETFKRAAVDRLMHEDGCPEGEQITAGIAAIAPAIFNAGLEVAAAEAERHEENSDRKFDGVIRRARKGERNLELAAATTAGMGHEARKIAAAIRALKAGGGNP